MDKLSFTGGALGLALTGALALAVPVEAVQPTSDDGTVTGVVLDDRTGAPVEGARVVMDDGSEMTTGPDGAFFFASPERGTRRIAAVTRGCRTAAGSFEVRSGRTMRLELMVDGVSPAADALETTESGEAVHVISGERLRELRHHTLLQALKREVPGVLGGGFERHGRRGSLALRGSRSGGHGPLLILNGTRVEQNVTDVLAQISAQDALRVEVVPGSSATTRHGTAAAYGLIRVIGRSGRDEVDPGTPADRCRLDWSAF